MNTARVSGFVQGAPELRITRDGRRILNFEIAVDDPGPHAPYIPIGYILQPGENLDLKAGEKITAIGPLRHHRSRGLFVAAEKIDRELEQRDSRKTLGGREFTDLLVQEKI
jgi:hypothetical protein